MSFSQELIESVKFQNVLRKVIRTFDGPRYHVPGPNILRVRSDGEKQNRVLTYYAHRVRSLLLRIFGWKKINKTRCFLLSASVGPNFFPSADTHVPPRRPTRRNTAPARLLSETFDGPHYNVFKSRDALQMVLSVSVTRQRTSAGSDGRRCSRRMRGVYFFSPSYGLEV